MFFIIRIISSVKVQKLLASCLTWYRNEAHSVAQALKHHSMFLKLKKINFILILKKKYLSL